LDPALGSKSRKMLAWVNRQRQTAELLKVWKAKARQPS
jgi:hypothetical protein